MKCKYNQEGVCINDQCPAYDRECPVPELAGVCSHEEREESYVLTPEGCATAALNYVGRYMNKDDFDAFWGEFSRLMKQFGYVREE